MKRGVRKLADWLSELIFPRHCPWCDRVLGYLPQCVCGGVPDALLLDNLQTTPRELPGGSYIDTLCACYRYEEPVREAIHRMKFENRPDLHRPLGQMMALRMAQSAALPAFDVLTPVPAHKTAQKTRGYNQSALLARVLAWHTGARLAPQLLAKTRSTGQQALLNREGRLHNVAGAFAAKPAMGLRVLLIDDVATTGSTLNECAKALKQAGALWCGAYCLASAEMALQVRQEKKD